MEQNKNKNEEEIAIEELLNSFFDEETLNNIEEESIEKIALFSFEETETEEKEKYKDQVIFVKLDCQKSYDDLSEKIALNYNYSKKMARNFKKERLIFKLSKLDPRVHLGLAYFPENNSDFENILENLISNIEFSVDLFSFINKRMKQVKKDYTIDKHLELLEANNIITTILQEDSNEFTEKERVLAMENNGVNYLPKKYYVADNEEREEVKKFVYSI